MDSLRDSFGDVSLTENVVCLRHPSAFGTTDSEPEKTILSVSEPLKHFGDQGIQGKGSKSASQRVKTSRHTFNSTVSPESWNQFKLWVHCQQCGATHELEHNTTDKNYKVQCDDKQAHLTVNPSKTTVSTDLYNLVLDRDKLIWTTLDRTISTTPKSKHGPFATKEVRQGLESASMATSISPKLSGGKSIRIKETVGENNIREIEMWQRVGRVPVTNGRKTFAITVSKFDDGTLALIKAISGYTPGPHSGQDGCLSRPLWTQRAISFATELGLSSLTIGFACHAEIQLMAYLLWRHTALYGGTISADDDEDDTRQKLDGIRSVAPKYDGLKATVYIWHYNGQGPCKSCEEYREIIDKQLGLRINFEVLRELT